MTKQLSITLDEELDAEIRQAAAGNISEWVATAARERLARETWLQYNATATALGINHPDWMAQQVATRESVR